MDGDADSDELKARRCAAAELAGAGLDVEAITRLTRSRVVAIALHEVYWLQKNERLEREFHRVLEPPVVSAFGHRPHP